ncbi:MAG: penicillin-binding transpeptidase domain-containing protein [Acidimicrobiaceae bacterium]|nr:penicillin-binding transpeptidase domain-containing protein [Acidimicrobiaceae bacterium]MCY4175291.1 penicillin-binding transpeptidase domain-containing protein [Acidimicrobiaceae bacterium]MCY4279674.1 penicillin-binding transpeptidase domain-containing protein [Acidimicrobiaceae bacterium]MCY4293376.1 penicillin-binding transpeptidase domain-containing protein [Acidimicrobiaceae bacterium]
MTTAQAESAGRRGFRLYVIGIVAICLVASLFARLWYLQVLERVELQDAAAANILRVVYTEAPRGRIFDVKGRILVDNRVVQVVSIDRRAFYSALSESEQRTALRELAAIISRSGRLTKVSHIEERLASQQFGPFDSVPVAFDIEPGLLVYLGERPDLFPGVTVEERTVRSYPYGELAAHLLGYVGPLTQAEYRAQVAQVGPSGIGADPSAKTYQPDDEIGKSGVERIFENQLRGVPGVRVLEVNRREEIVRVHDDKSRHPMPGSDVHLTIDLDVQSLLEQELRRGLDEARRQELPEDEPDAPEFVASSGAAVALDPRDGSILAMASFPTFDPGDFVNGISQRLFDDLVAEENYSPILNRAIQGLYPPGSTFKLVTAYASMTQGVIGDDPASLLAVDDFYTDIGTYRYPYCTVDSDTCVFNSPYCCERGVDLRDALTVSSDTYFYRLGGEGFFLRPEPLDEGIQESARAFGLGAHSGIPLPNERPGVVPDKAYYDYQFEQGVFQRSGDQWFAGDTINLSIGQGNLLVTPLQMANMYAVTASGGKLHQPSIATKITDRSGAVLDEFGPRLLRQIEWPAEISEPLLDGLNGVTAYNLTGSSEATLLRGTAFEAFNRPGEGGVDFPLDAWPVAGKTGTAEKQGQADYAWFVGFGPSAWPERGLVHTPEVVVSMVLEEAGFGGDVAAPAVARVLLPIATDTVERALTAAEVDICYNEVKLLASFFEGMRTGAIKVDSDGEPISTAQPQLSQHCSELVGGPEAVEESGLDALP